MSKTKSFKINALLNTIKQCCAIIFPMITFPYVSRVLGVEGYGEYNFAVSVVSYFTLFAGLGVNSYAVREGAKIRENMLDFRNFANEVFSINMVSTFLAYVFMLFLIFSWNRLDNCKIIMLIISLNILTTTIGTDWINVVFEDFYFITIRYIICQTLGVLFILLFVKSYNDLYLYAFFGNFGTISANLINVFYIRKKLDIKIHFTFKMNLRKHLKPILILFGNAVSAMIYLYSDSTMLGIFIGDIAVGYYAVASKIYALVKQVLNAIASAAIPNVSHDMQIKDYRLSKKINELLGILLIFVLPCVTGLQCVGKEVIIVLSSAEYINANSALFILSISLIFSTVACIFINVVMLSNGMDKEILISSLISGVVNIVLNLILIPIYSINAAAFTTLVSEFIMMLRGYWYTRKIVKIQVIKYIIIGTLGGVWVFGVCQFLKILITNSFLYLTCCILVSAIGYLAFLFIYFRRSKAEN